MITIDLSGHVVLVMGGGGSIGAQIARTSAEAGAFVIVADAHDERAHETAEEIRKTGAQAAAVQVDLTDSGSVQSCVEAAVASGGSLTGLVNAAGIWRSAPSEFMSDEMWHAMMDVNLSGVFRSSRAAVPALKSSGTGSIVNVSSTAAFVGSAESAPYSATKAGVIGYSTGLAGELASFGIRVNAICPGWVDGGFTTQALESADDPALLLETARSQHFLNRLATPTDVANAAVWLLSDFSSFVTGTALFVDGGYMVKH